MLQEAQSRRQDRDKPLQAHRAKVQSVWFGRDGNSSVELALAEKSDLKRGPARSGAPGSKLCGRAFWQGVGSQWSQIGTTGRAFKARVASGFRPMTGINTATGG